jgi:hypothetical protein
MNESADGLTQTIGSAGMRFLGERQPEICVQSPSGDGRFFEPDLHQRY